MSKLFNLFKTLSERRNVSKPQILSRLRYVNVIKRPDETEQERLYREQYNNLQDWNEKYWAENNAIFNREKENYIKKHLRAPNKTSPSTTADDQEALSHDQLAPFYRDFLNKNRQKHVSYNKTWYINHLTLLISSLKAKASRLNADLRGKQ